VACALPACSTDSSAESGETCFTLADGRCVVETFENPPVLEPDASGVYQLDLAPTEVTLDGQRHCVRAYNGSYVGPTIETPARVAGESRSVRINLANRLFDHDFRSLDGDECSCTDDSGASCLPEHVHDACAKADGSAADDTCVCRNADGEECEHMFDFNVTNLHAHGAHTWPDFARGGEECQVEMDDGVMLKCRQCDTDVCDSGDQSCYHADDVLNSVHPGFGAKYRWDIDEDGTHHTGLNWFHPHIHGTTAMQVASGAAGAWIIRGELDELPGIARAKERVMVFSTPSIGTNGFEPLADGEECTEDTITFNNFKTLGSTTSPQVNMINGERRPRLVTPPGQVERWRILHAGFLDEVFFGVFRGTDADCTSFSTEDVDTLRPIQIGRDGLVLPQFFSDDYMFMSPGYRIETVFGGEGQLEDGETWCLVAARALDDANEGAFGEFGEQPISPGTIPTRDEIFDKFRTAGDVVAILNVTASAGEPTETELPEESAVAAQAPSLQLDGRSADELCAEAQARTDPTAIDQVAMLQVGFWTVDDPDPCGCEAYNVNCGNFEYVDRSVYPFDRDMPLNAVEHWRIGASMDGHPFHIHINPYVVCPADNPFDPLPFPHWRDTYLVNARRQIDIITQNKSFTGAFVFHCHKLTHEDHGMMEVVRVCDPATDPTCGDYDWRACAEGDIQCLRGLAATDCAMTARTDLETAACVQSLTLPGAVCAPNSCGVDADCMDADRCEAMACVPAPCEPPCAPGQACVHGVCG
jgi:FtsP/CotA-like multicopper oxidase with cupredoxin domain